MSVSLRITAIAKNGVGRTIWGYHSSKAPKYIKKLPIVAYEDVEKVKFEVKYYRVSFNISGEYSGQYLEGDNDYTNLVTAIHVLNCNLAMINTMYKEI